MLYSDIPQNICRKHNVNNDCFFFIYGIENNKYIYEQIPILEDIKNHVQANKDCCNIEGIVHIV